ncbi:MAG TPA: hypothetical protein VLN49_07480 [Gemmatimonadaceae bacterium]|nr:hypothetical protein [Gemmatimonadaceae bacterium]
MRPTWLACTLLGATVGVLPAQDPASMRAGVSSRHFESDTASEWRTAGSRQPVRAGPRTRPFAPLTSAVLPGSGQYLLGQDRFVLYAAAEALVWWQYGKHAREQVQQQRAFKEFARRVARAHFSANAPDGPWSYYEAMRDFSESGDYSKADSGPVVPEPDTDTFNGHLWQQALQTHATVADALAQYERDAIKPDFQWSWRNASIQWDVFKQLTNKRNDAFRAAQQDLMMIAANHVLSMVDAFATFRLQVRPDSRGGGSLGASFSW